MHSTQTKNSLAKRLIKSVGIFFSLVLVFTTSTYAWAPGQAPQALPGSGNVDLPSNSWSLNDSDVFNISGNVGIGTSEPNAQLVTVQNGSLSNDTSAYKTNAGLRIIKDDDGYSLNFDANQIETLNTSLLLNYGSANNIILAGGGGNVGIGTTSPDANLHVEGGGYDSPQLILSSSSGAAIRLRDYGSGDHQDIWLKNDGTNFAVEGDDTHLVIEGVGGNVGIGTTSPGANLHVESSEANIARFYSPSTSYGEIFIGQSLTTNKATALGYNVNGGYTFLQTYGDPWGTFVIKNGGNVGIGTTSPGAKLHVEAGSSEGLRIMSYFGNTHLPYTDGWSYLSGKGIVFRTNGNSERMRIDISGNIGIGTNSPSSGLKLDIEGKVGATEYCDQNGNNCKTTSEMGGTDTNAITKCPNDQFLDGDGSCLTKVEIVSGGGGGGTLSCRNVKATTQYSNARSAQANAQCSGGETLTGCSCSCDAASDQPLTTVHESTWPEPNPYRCTCFCVTKSNTSWLTSTAQAVCCNID